MKERPLTPTEGKVLRYIADPLATEPREPAEVVNKLEWSDLPSTLLEARAVFERLRSWGFIKKAGKKYEPTKKGRDRIRRANKNGEWNS